MKLFSVRQVVVATVLGSPIAGSILLFMNYRRAGKPGASVMLAVGLGLTGALFALGQVLPDKMALIGSIASVVGMWQVAERVMPAIKESAGPSTDASWIAPIVMPLGIIALLFAGVLGYLVMTEPPSISAGPDADIQYLNGATEADAQDVKAALAKVNLMPAHGWTVRVERDGASLVMKFMMTEGAWDEAPVVEDFAKARKRIQEEMPKAPLIFEMCDDDWDAKKTIR